MHDAHLLLCSSAKLCLTFAESLSSSSAAVQIFDPLNMSEGANPKDIKKWREAEIKHGRVAMLAALGVLVAEVRHRFPLLYRSCERGDTTCRIKFATA